MRWLFGILILLGLALVLQLSLLVYAGYVLLGLFVLSRLLAKNWTQHVSARRKFTDQTAEIGEKFDIAITVENDGKLPVPWVIIEDVLPPEALSTRPPRLKLEGKRQKVGMIPGEGSLRLRYALVPQMRGFYRIGPVMLEGGDLFGLFRRFRLCTQPHFLLVFPRTIPLLGYDLASRRPIGEIRLTHKLFEDPTRIAGIREYQQGDPLNRVHWKATARTGKLHCKLYEPSTMAGATLLLEFHKPAFDARGEPFRSELGITLAAALADALYQLGQPFGLVTNGRDAAERLRGEGWQVPLGGGVFRSRSEAAIAVAETSTNARLQPITQRLGKDEEHLAEMRELLARLELNDGLSFAELLTEAGSQISRQATVVALLPGAPPATALALGNLRRRGYAVTAVLLIIDEVEGSEHYARLAAEQIATLSLRDEAGISTLCSGMLGGR